MPVTCLTTMITMRPPSGLGTKPTVGFFLHLWYLLSTSVPFSLGASEDTLVESRYPKWRKKPTVGLVPRPEGGHMVIMVVRQVTGISL